MKEAFERLDELAVALDAAEPGTVLTLDIIRTKDGLRSVVVRTFIPGNPASEKIMQPPTPESELLTYIDGLIDATI